MIAIGETLISEDVFDTMFACDIQQCKGACCVEGESGAPLTAEEVDRLEEAFEIVKPLLRPEALEVIEKVGLFEVDQDGDFVTPIIDGRECVYATFDERGIAKCSFETAWREGKSSWPKPISCHLYPIRLKELQDFTALNVHRWPICDGARTCGAANQITVLEFCRSALIRQFGDDWYDEAYHIWTEWKKQQRNETH
ncbi:MAG: DUF3109 family protein [Bacteroidetes bacterium]|nr:DUF3109 family protein [Bacteroidota bacterium]